MIYVRREKQPSNINKPKEIKPSVKVKRTKRKENKTNV